MPRMGWMQLKRWLSFLPVAFALYMLLHYLVYQTSIQDPQSSYLSPSRIVKLSVSDIKPPEMSMNSKDTNLKTSNTINSRLKSADVNVLTNSVLENTEKNPIFENENSLVLLENTGQRNFDDSKIASTPKTVENSEINLSGKENTNDALFPHSDTMGQLLKKSIQIQEMEKEVNTADIPANYIDSPVQYTGSAVQYDDSLVHHDNGQVQQYDSQVQHDDVQTHDDSQGQLYSKNPAAPNSDYQQQRYGGNAAITPPKEIQENPPGSYIALEDRSPSFDNDASNHQSIIIPRELLSKEDKGVKKKDESGSTVVNVSATSVDSKEKVPVVVSNGQKNVSIDSNKETQDKDNQEVVKPFVDSTIEAAKHEESNVSKPASSSGSREMRQNPPSKSQIVKSRGASVQPHQSVVKGSSRHAINSLKGKLTINEKYEKGFSTPHEEICPNNGRDLRVLILITTAPNHEKHRNAVRQTWGHFAMRKDVAIAFVVGRTSNTDVQNVIDKENDRYGDIIEANFIDHYSNLTLKTVSMFEWANKYCSESHFVLKTDDDMFINVPLLLAFISAKKNEKQVIFGRLAKGWKPIRNSKSKYYIDKETYNRPRYPEFLTGPAYLFTSDVVEKIYQKALHTTFFILEDVFLTGFIGESLGIRRIGDSHFRNEKITLKDTCKLMQSISIHMVKYEEQFDIYKRTLDGKTKCKTR